jgi:hypothetical protein
MEDHAGQAMPAFTPIELEQIVSALIFSSIMVSRCKV